MAWHRAEHRGYYDCDYPRVETHYFYPKPWEAMRIGPRASRTIAPQEPHQQRTEEPDDSAAETLADPLDLPYDTQDAEELAAPLTDGDDSKE